MADPIRRSRSLLRVRYVRPPTTTSSPKKLLTPDEYREFLNRPENADRLFELRHGKVIELPRPKKPHGIVCTRVATQLQLYADRVGLGYVLSNDTGVVLEEEPGTVVGPDVANCTDANRFEDVEPQWVDVRTPPVLAVEVLSPTDRIGELNERIAEYLRAGVRVVWLVDPETKTVTVYRRNQHLQVVKADQELTGGEELPGFSCRVADLFRLPGDWTSATSAAPIPSLPVPPSEAAAACSPQPPPAPPSGS